MTANGAFRKRVMKQTDGFQELARVMLTTEMTAQSGNPRLRL